VVEVLAKEPGAVTGMVKTGGDVVFLEAVGLEGLPAPIATFVAVGPYAGVVGILAPEDGGTTGAAKRQGDEGFVEAHPRSLSSAMVFGMYLWVRSSARMSSARIKTKLGLVGLA
jgi:hypothetical protein